jgi:hypothetical protein
MYIILNLNLPDHSVFAIGCSNMKLNKDNIICVSVYYTNASEKAINISKSWFIAGFIKFIKLFVCRNKSLTNSHRHTWNASSSY